MTPAPKPDIDGASEAPLEEELRAIPFNHRLVIIGEGIFPSSTSIPAGAIAHRAAAALEALREERDAALADARRYRFACEHPDGWWPLKFNTDKAAIDAAIDAALAAKEAP